MNSLPDDFWGRVVYLLQQYGPSFLRGAGTTMLIAVISTAVGCLIGFGVGIVQTTPTDKAHPVKYYPYESSSASCWTPMWRYSAAHP